MPEIKQLPDFSEWCVGPRAIQEEMDWILTGSHQNDVAWLAPLIEKYDVKTVLEAGCGSGILASLLPPSVTKYGGLDKNAWFLDKARNRIAERPGFTFTCFDVRNVLDGGPGVEPVDLGMSFAFLKHFGLDEHDRILQKILSWGEYGALGLQLAQTDFDNGVEYHHSFVTWERTLAAIEAAGHEVLEKHLQTEWSLPDCPEAGTCSSVLVWTKRKTTQAGSVDRVDLAEKPTEETKAFWDKVEAGELDTAAAVKLIAVEVAGSLRPDLYRYTVRFDHDGNPVLYQDGKRLTCPWRLKIDWGQGEDPHGGNANTA